MASSFQCLLLLLLVLFIAPSSSSSFAKSSFRPKALVIPVAKDASTNQYVTQIHQRTPLVPLNLVLDLGGQFLWVDCEQKYTSSTYRPARCNSAQCSLADSSICGDCFSPPRPGCNNNTCGIVPDNPVLGTTTLGDVGQDIISVQSTNGFNPGRTVAAWRFIFSCAPSFLLDSLAKGVSGMAGLGRTKIALPSQFAASFSFPKKFAICLTSGGSKGVVFFGDGPYGFLPNVDASIMLGYTPLILNPVSTASASTEGQPSAEYFIGVKSIKVDHKVLPNINRKLLSINKEGVGGTKISTVNPYTVLEASIFKAVTKAFIEGFAERNLTSVASVAPFEVCFSSHNVVNTRSGPWVPIIELVLQNNEGLGWQIAGGNSVVQVNDDVMCLAMLNGGDKPMTSIVIGGYQLEDNLLQFDLASSRLGFSNSLLWQRTNCANFNFTSTAGMEMVRLEKMKSIFDA